MASSSFHQADIFKSLPEEERNSLLQEAITREVSKGEYLVHQEEIWPHVVFVESGQIRWTMLSTGGKEHVLFSLESSEVFWAHSIFDDNPMPASLVASKKSRVLIWNRETILRYLRRYPDVMWEVTRKLTGIMRQAREIIYGLAFKPVAGRLATLLLQQCMDCDGTSDGTLIDRNFTLNELASTVAATPEVVCRLLYQFQEDGILEITRASIHIHDMDALRNAEED